MEINGTGEEHRALRLGVDPLSTGHGCPFEDAPQDGGRCQVRVEVILVRPGRAKVAEVDTVGDDPRHLFQVTAYAIPGRVLGLSNPDPRRRQSRGQCGGVGERRIGLRENDLLCGDLLLTLLHLTVMTATLCGPGGVRAVIAENLLLKQQLIVLRRRRQRAPHLTASDRLLFGFGSLFLSPGRIRKVAIGVRPSTLLAFHQALVRRTYRRLFSSSECPKQPGPKGPSEALIQAIVELTSRTPRFGCPRSARIISRTFGANIDKHVVYRVLSTHYRPIPGGTGPSWLSFIGHTTDSLWSVDLFRCESIVLRSDWVLVVMDQFTRRLVGVGVHRGLVNGADLCRMFNAAIHGRGAPRHLSTDHDPLFEAHRWTANLRILEDEIKTVPHVPRSHPFVERLIGTTRRECLDHVLFWNARDLERTLADFQAYYNEVRSHASLKGHTPLTFAGGHMVARAELNNVRWVSHCRDLVQLPVAA